MSWQWLAGAGVSVALLAAFILWCAHLVSKTFNVEL